MLAKPRHRRKQPAETPELSPEAGWKLLDETARQQLGISAEAFVRAWQAGEIAASTRAAAVFRDEPAPRDRAQTKPRKGAAEANGQNTHAGESNGVQRRRRRKLPEVRELSLEEGKELFDRTARYFLGISGEEFLRRWDAGEITNPDTPEVMPIIMSLPFVRDCP